MASRAHLPYLDLFIQPFPHLWSEEGCFVEKIPSLNQTEDPVDDRYLDSHHDQQVMATSVSLPAASRGQGHIIANQP